MTHRFVTPLRVAAACATLILLAGCSSRPSPNPPESSTMTPSTTSSMTPAQSRAEVDDLYGDVTKHLGGTWKVGGEEWQECTTTSGTDGANFSFLSQRLDQSLASQPDVTARDVEALWATRGVRASIAVDKSLTPPHYILSDPAFGAGSSADGFLVQLTVSAVTVSFNATGRCVAGNAEKLNGGASG